MQRGLGFVEMLDERDDPALVAERLLFFLNFILKGDGQSLVQEGQLAEALSEDIEAKLQSLEDLAVRLEDDLRPTLPRYASVFESLGRFPSLIALLEDLTVLPDFDLQPLGEGIHDRDAHAVESTGHLVGPLLELAAGMEHGQGDLGRGLLLCRVHAGGDSATVVHHHDAPVYLDRHLDRLPESGHVLVDAVVHHLVHQVVQPLRTGRADIHGGALADGVQPFQDLNLIRRVPFFRLVQGVLSAVVFVFFEACVFSYHPLPRVTFAAIP